MKTSELQLTNDWDKTFPQNNRVEHKKVTFYNRYGITLAADMYKPKDAKAYCRQSPFPVLLELLKSRLPDCMHRQWLKKGF